MITIQDTSFRDLETKKELNNIYIYVLNFGKWMSESLKMKYGASSTTGLGDAVVRVCLLLAGLSVESNHVIGEEGSSITVGCTYSAKYRYVFFTVPHVRYWEAEIRAVLSPGAPVEL